MHTRNEKFKCTKCPSSFKHESILHAHYRKAHNTTASLYNCTFCPKELPTKFEWAVHELKHAGWKYYKCVRCKGEFINASMFQRHLTGKDTTSTCPGGTDISGEELKTYRAQSRKDWESDHARIIGDKKSLEEIAQKKPVFTCSFCQQSFTRKLEWAVHELRHTGWKEYKCVKCGKECGNAATFHAHVYRKVQSDDCTGGEGLTKEELALYYKESKKDWYSEHTRIVGSLTTFNEKDFKQPIPAFKCCFCSREFTTRSDLAIHELHHTGWNQFKCIKCGKECSYPSTFHEHVYRKKGHKTCKGGTGLSKTELDEYRKQSTKDWASEHARIIGGMTQREKDDIRMEIDKMPGIHNKKTKSVVRHKPLNKLSKPAYTCSFCDMKLGTKFAWACHELEHKGWKYYQCVKCGREFSRNCTTTFHEHIYCKRQKQKCPGGKGMNPKDFETFRDLCKKDWQAEHDRIIGTKENAGCSNKNASDVENDSETENSPEETLEDVTNEDVQGEFRAVQEQHRTNNCRVVLTPLNNVQNSKDSQASHSSSGLNLTTAKGKSGPMSKGYGMKKCTVVLTRLNILSVMPVAQ